MGLRKSSQKPQNNNDKPDSMTNVYKPIPMDRVVVSVRIRPEIKDALKRFCRANGLSICHVFEGLVSGFLVGVNEQIEFVNKSPTINAVIPRQVMRARRYVHEVDDSPPMRESTRNKRGVNPSMRELSGSCVVCGCMAYAVVTRPDFSRVQLCREHFLDEDGRGIERKFVSFRILEPTRGYVKTRDYVED